MQGDPAAAKEYYHRALVHAATGRDKDAADDLDRAIAALPALPPELLHREQPRPYLERAKLAHCPIVAVIGTRRLILKASRGYALAVARLRFGM